MLTPASIPSAFLCGDFRGINQTEMNTDFWWITLHTSFKTSTLYFILLVSGHLVFKSGVGRVCFGMQRLAVELLTLGQLNRCLPQLTAGRFFASTTHILIHRKFWSMAQLLLGLEGLHQLERALRSFIVARSPPICSSWKCLLSNANSWRHCQDSKLPRWLLATIFGQILHSGEWMGVRGDKDVKSVVCLEQMWLGSTALIGLREELQRIQGWGRKLDPSLLAAKPLRHNFHTCGNRKQLKSKAVAAISTQKSCLVEWGLRSYDNFWHGLINGLWLPRVSPLFSAWNTTHMVSLSNQVFFWLTVFSNRSNLGTCQTWMHEVLAHACAMKRPEASWPWLHSTWVWTCWTEGDPWWITANKRMRNKLNLIVWLVASHQRRVQLQF